MSSIFAGNNLFTQYRVTAAFRNKIMGGIPKDPKTIEGWLTSKAGVTDEEEVRYMTRRTLLELGIDIPESANIAEMMQAAEAIAATKSTNGFKRDTTGLYVEGRQIKAMMKEATNVLFAGERWGPTRKGPKSYLAERVYVGEDTVPLGRTEPDGVDMVIGHVTGPQGPKSTLTYHEFCEGCEITFTVMSLQDCISADQWQTILILAQELGLGALRSQGHGRFDVLDMVRVAQAKNPPKFLIRDAV